jgi:hypothetical protein
MTKKYDLIKFSKKNIYLVEMQQKKHIWAYTNSLVKATFGSSKKSCFCFIGRVKGGMGIF